MTPVFSRQATTNKAYKKLRVQQGASLSGLEACRLKVTGCPFLLSAPQERSRHVGIKDQLFFVV